MAEVGTPVSMTDVVELLRAVAYSDGPEQWVDDLQELVDMAKDELGDTPSGTSLEALWELRKVVKGLAAASKEISAVIDQKILVVLGPAGAIKLDDKLVRSAPAGSWALLDPEGLAEDIGDAKLLAQVCKVEPRVKGLTALAKERKLDPNHFLDTYCWKDVGAVKLAIQGEGQSGTPKYAQAMTHGETRGIAGE